jgi:two-component system sensor histidine kinase/response regulator
MVIDDTPANLLLLEEVLSESDYIVAAFPSGELGLAAAHSVMPDLIMLDIMMPGRDGYATCEAFKSNARFKDIPVIFISALNQSFDKVKAFEAGGVDYVSKPFQPEEVLARVATHLSLRRQRRQIEAQEAELRENLFKLGELEKQRDALVHMVAHDMKSPLSSIIMCCEMVQQVLPAITCGVPSEKDRELCSRMLGGIRNAGERLRELVGSFLDVSRIEANAMPLMLNNHDLREVVAEVVALFVPRLNENVIQYSPPSDPVVGFCDRDLVFRVLQNLIENALAHGGATPYVVVDIRKESGEVVIKVRDDGPGVPIEFQSSIFDKYCQVDMHSRAINLGTGLGLTFCKLAVESQNGRIGLVSLPGEGSTFWFTVPSEQAVGVDSNAQRQDP